MSGPMTRRTHRWWASGVVAAIVVIAVGVLLALGLNADPSTPGMPLGPVTPSSTGASAPATATVALVVKIDNVAAARPATGLGSADVIYVEPVEGGVTRLVAVYLGAPPTVIGPVRSARGTDIELLGQYGRPVLAYSGAAPELLPALHAANLVNASPAEASEAFSRDPDRAAPHNLYLRPHRLPDGGTAAAEPALRFGAASATGAPCSRHEIDFRATGFTFTWSPEAKRWLVSMDATPMTTTESGRLAAATVIEQRVETSAAESGEDGPGPVSPVARTIGQGRATVLRDGQRFDVNWSRPTKSAPTQFHTESGTAVPLAPGPVWILLLPA
jgi:hypothetical protein